MEQALDSTGQRELEVIANFLGPGLERFNATVDFKLSGEYDRYFWSVSVNNVFNALYYDYAIASAFTPDRFNAYPLPGRTFWVKAGAKF